MTSFELLDTIFFIISCHIYVKITPTTTSSSVLEPPSRALQLSLAKLKIGAFLTVVKKITSKNCQISRFTSYLRQKISYNDVNQTPRTATTSTSFHYHHLSIGHKISLRGKKLQFFVQKIHDDDDDAKKTLKTRYLSIKMKRLVYFIIENMLVNFYA